jgi:hypothetical protein
MATEDNNLLRRQLSEMAIGLGVFPEAQPKNQN